MRPVLTKGRGEQMHHQDQHSNSQVIVVGEQYVHCLLESRVTVQEKGARGRTEQKGRKGRFLWDI